VLEGYSGGLDQGSYGFPLEELYSLERGTLPREPSRICDFLLPMYPSPLDIPQELYWLFVAVAALYIRTDVPYIASARHSEHWLTKILELPFNTTQPNKGESISGECSPCRVLAI